MFTGLVDDIGIIEHVEVTGAGRELRVRTSWTDLAGGESIACNGACLTVRESGREWFTVAAVVTTLGRTMVDRWEVGTRLNLERSLRIGDRLGGHLVQGHVDGVATVVAVVRHEDALLIDIALAEGLAELVVPHGSIAVDGVSLTVNAIPAPGVVQLSIIEYTLRRTTLGDLLPGSAVHVEMDVVGKYVRRLVDPYRLRRDAHAGQL